MVELAKLKTDSVAWPVVRRVLDEIGKAFLADGIDISRIVPQWSETPILDVGDGPCATEQAWVRLVTQVPTRQFPAPNGAPVWGGRNEPGAPVRFATTIEVGVVHCTGWGVDENFVPSTDEYMADAERAFAEMASVRRAIVRAMVAEKREYQFVSFSPLNDGLSSGGMWQVTFDWMRGS